MGVDGRYNVQIPEMLIVGWVAACGEVADARLGRSGP